MADTDVACQLCIARDGLSHAPRFYSPEAFVMHLENIHHVPTRQPGETFEQMRQRFLRENPSAWGGPNVS